MIKEFNIQKIICKLYYNYEKSNNYANSANIFLRVLLYKYFSIVKMRIMNMKLTILLFKHINIIV